MLAGRRGPDEGAGDEGKDIVRLGRGDDVGEYSIAANLGVRDRYEGGPGHDILSIFADRQTLVDLDLTMPEIEAVFDAEVGSGRVTFNEIGLKLTAIGFEEIMITAERTLDFAVVQRAKSQVQIFFNLPSGKIRSLKPVKVQKDPSAMITADIDIRGGPDVIVASNAKSTVELLANNGQGQLRREGPVKVGSNPSALAAGNLRGDQHPEVVVANSGDNTVQVLNANDGELVAGKTYPVGPAPSDVAIADIDGVNGLDVLAVSPSASTLTVLLNDGAGNLVAQPAQPVATGATVLAAGELNGQPGADVAIAGSASVQVFENDGSGNLAGNAPLAIAGPAVDVSLGDMDATNGRDVVVRTDGAIQVFLNDGSGGLNPLAAVAAAGSSSFVIAHLDNKPGPDTLLASPALSLVQILRNDGAGGLIENRSRKAGGSPTFVGIGNFDGG